jgi:hypothetical protein
MQKPNIVFGFFKKGHYLCPLFFCLLSCVNKQPPIEEYNLAQAAYRSAQESEAKRYAPKIFSNAVRYYKRAERAYEERYFNKATDYFRKSRYYSEKAENMSRLNMFKQGELGQ